MSYKKIKDEKKLKKQMRSKQPDVTRPKEPQYKEELFKEEKRMEHVLPNFLRLKLAKRYGWHKEDGKTLPFLSILQLSRIPVYFFTLQMAPFALVPSLMPWKYVDFLFRLFYSYNCLAPTLLARQFGFSSL